MAFVALIAWVAVQKAYTAIVLRCVCFLHQVDLPPKFVSFALNLH